MIVFISIIFEVSQVYISCAIKSMAPFVGVCVYVCVGGWGAPFNNIKIRVRKIRFKRYGREESLETSITWAMAQVKQAESHRGRLVSIASPKR